MDRHHQKNLIVGAIEDYQNGLMSLGMLIQKIEGFIETTNDQTLKDSTFSSFLAPAEVYARTQAGDFDFEKDGQAVVNRSIAEIITVMPD